MDTGEYGTDAFARRLREIREASGRSYGALARRVGVSASTLHRYCSGSTVPLEFAPVERLARLCGCQGEELVALHRLWMLADADRRRRQEAAGSAPKGASPASARAGAAAPVASGSAGAASDASDGSADTSAGSAGPSGPGQEDLGDFGEGVIVLGERPGAADGARQNRRSGVVTGARGRSRMVRTAVAAVAAVVALVLLVAYDGVLFAGDDQQRTTAQEPDGGGVDASPSGGGGTSPSGTPSRSGSASPSVTASPTGPPKPLGTRAADNGAGGKKGPGAKASSAAPSSSTKPQGGGTPFTVRTDQHVWDAGCAHTYLVGRGPTAVPPPPAESDARAWAASVGAVHGGETMVRFTVQGTSERAVVLEALRVRVVARRGALEQNAYRMSLGCGGSITPRQFEVDLEQPRPIARSVAGGDADGEIPAVSFPYRVSAKDPEVLLVTAKAVSCDCDWYLELEWSSGDRSGVTRIDDAGRPFRTSGVRGRPTFDYDYAAGARRWIPAG